MILKSVELNMLIIIFFISPFLVNCQNLSNTSSPFNLITDSSTNSSPVTGQEIYRSVVCFNSRILNRTYKNDEEYLYKLDSTIRREPSENSALSNTTKLEYIYEESRILVLLFSYEENTDNWFPNSFNAFHLDANQNIIKQTFNIWDGDYSQLTEENPSVIRNYFYNGENQILRLEIQNQQAINENRLSHIYNFKYNLEGKLTNVSFALWSESHQDLLDESNFIYRYNTDLLLQELVHLKFNQNAKWIYEDSTFINYNNDGLLIKELFFDYTNNEGLFLFKILNYNYNSDNTLNFIKEQRDYNEANQNWRHVETTHFDYYPFGSVEFIITNDSLPFGEMQRLYQSEFLYDNSIISNEIYPSPRLPSLTAGYRPVAIKNHMVTHEIQYFEDIITGYTLDYVDNHFYSDIISSSVNYINDNWLNAIEIFPNPANESINILMNEDYVGRQIKLQLYNMSGEMIIHKDVNIEDTISISKLSKGIYFYILRLEDNVVSGKFIKS